MEKKEILLDQYLISSKVERTRLKLQGQRLKMKIKKKIKKQRIILTKPIIKMVKRNQMAKSNMKMVIIT